MNSNVNEAEDAKIDPSSGFAMVPSSVQDGADRFMGRTESYVSGGRMNSFYYGRTDSVAF